MFTEPVLLMLSSTREVNVYRNLNISLYNSLLLGRIENSMLESMGFQSFARAFCWVVNCQSNRRNLTEIVVSMHVESIISTCDL
jgi:hypothetical protein